MTTDPAIGMWPREAKAGAVVFIGIGAAALLGGCSLPYYWQAAAGQLSMLSKRVPIETAIEDPQISVQTREALSAVLEIRRFAVDELGLPDNNSYSTYVDLESDRAGPERDNAGVERTSAVWTVVAAEEFSIAPRTWCFPFVGCVSYRGYFNEAAARRYAARLEAEGLDVAVGGATAYSTLGYFADPVVSTMIRGPNYRIVELLIHELAHQKFYLKGDSDLNEAFATAVAEYGTQRWLTQSGDAGSLEAYRNRVLGDTRFAELIGRHRERLQAIYAGPQPAEEKRLAKEAAFATLRAQYIAQRDTWDGGANYEAWFARPLNNAHIASVATYEYWVPGLLRLLETRGLDVFYEEVEALAALDTEQRRERLQDWLDSAAADSEFGGDPADR